MTDCNNVVRVDDDAHGFVAEFARDKDLTFGEAATVLVKRGNAAGGGE